MKRHPVNNQIFKIGRYRRRLLRICFPMDRNIKKIFYITLDENAEKLKRKVPLAVYRCERKMPFAGSGKALGKRCAADSEVQIYFSLLPDSFVKDMGKTRKRKQWLQKLRDAVGYAQGNPGRGYEDIICSDRLSAFFKRQQELPEELFASGLYAGRVNFSFKHINITIPKDCSSLMAERVIRLLGPYLPQINTVSFVGEETENTYLIEDYLYEEYGIITSYQKRPEKNTVWLDFEEEKAMLLTPYVLENGIYHINRNEVLKFLDTTVKSGYNTKVN